MNKVCIVTGSSGLIGSESVKYFAKKFERVIGIDNNMRAYFFGKSASIECITKDLEQNTPNFQHNNIDIRNLHDVELLFKTYGFDIELIIHAAAQPSHDWAAKEPLTDFGVNAIGTINLLELTRLHCPKAVFIFTSTNKVYGDTPNFLPLVEFEKRWEIDKTHPYFKNGIDENMSIDQSKHSVFGASKVAADILVQEYGQYFNINAGIFRGGCLTGPNHLGAQLHGFLSYLMKCAIEKEKYTIFGYKGKQVRDNIHSYDLIKMFEHFFDNPRKGEVYNVGGGRFSNCSVVEGIELCQEISGNKINYNYIDKNRMGDHIWYISDISKFKSHYPKWNYKYDLKSTLIEMHDNMIKRY